MQPEMTELAAAGQTLKEEKGLAGLSWLTAWRQSSTNSGSHKKQPTPCNDAPGFPACHDVTGKPRGGEGVNIRDLSVSPLWPEMHPATASRDPVDPVTTTKKKGHAR